MAKILIVEDDPFAIEDYQESLRDKYGHHLLFADRPDEAIDMLKQNPDIDLVILDLNLLENTTSKPVADYLCDVVWKGQPYDKKPLVVTSSSDTFSVVDRDGNVMEVGRFEKGDLMFELTRPRSSPDEINPIDAILAKHGINKPGRPAAHGIGTSTSPRDELKA